MTDTFKIKRSDVTPAPASLSPGELAYSEVSHKLFYGRISDGAPVDIGGKWVADKINNLQAADITNFNAAVDGRIGNANLDALADVHVPAPSDGQTLTWNAAQSRWEAQAPSTGVTTFIALNDTPTAYAGAGGAFVRVKADASGLEFVSVIDGGTF
jgi:hypothetical protein